jgi:group II intron reverse transcriptase/maturase
LEVIYEEDFLDCSFGFRPGRSPHDALRSLNDAVHRGTVNVVLEADIVSFFDRINRKKLKELLGQRLDDKSLMRLIGKCLHVGVLDKGVIINPEKGTVQGSTLSPLLANIYLHYVLDLWFENEIKPSLQGKAILVRYCDDFIIGFEKQADALQVKHLLGERLAEYDLELHPDKTRLVDFRRPPKSQQGGKGPGSFDFLGFTHYWIRSRKGNWHMVVKTKRARQIGACKALSDWCRRHRHESVPSQHAALKRKLYGHCNYFAVQGNAPCISSIFQHARGTWHKWLNRRSQRSRLTWDRFEDLLRDFPLRPPSITKSLWASNS